MIGADEAPGGAWQHRWGSLTMDDVHGVADLPVLGRADDRQRHEHPEPAFVPYHRGQGLFAGEQLHTADYPGPEHFRGRRTLVVGGGASAIRFLGELRPVTDTVWVTRSQPV